ncbi:MAG: chloride channel protein [Firmicutes bacterium]|nr:chloride channel protein [Bacillota bacterium]
MFDTSGVPFRTHLRQLQVVVRRTGFASVGLVTLVTVVGILSAFAVRVFEAIVDRLFQSGYRDFPAFLTRHALPGWAAFLVFPLVVGLLVAGVKLLVPQADRPHSVPLVIISMLKRDGRLRPVSTLLKSIAAILTLGAGGSLGREGPVVLLGGGVGSALGQLLRLPPDWLNTLIAAGAGAAVATAFHAPITGAFFAMEIVLIQFSSRSFALVALACVAASQTSQLLVGAPAFPIPAYQMHSPWEIAIYLVLGLLIAPLARLYIGVIYGAEHAGKAVTFIPSWLKPALGGVLFGVVAILLPRTLGGGYETISDALVGKLSLGLLVFLLVAKLVTIGLTSGSGWPGGVFTPALFLGSMAGGAFGLLAHALFPGLVTQPGAYAVVGMAAMIAGAAHAPLTAMTLIFEVTRDYRVAMPAMLACGVAAVFSQRLSPYSIDTLHLPEHGVLLPWQVQDLRGIRVGDVMSRAVHTVRTDMQLKTVIERMQQHRHGGYPVLDPDGLLAGMLTLRDVREVPLAERLETPVSAAMAPHLVVVTPEQSMADAALLMARHRIGRLPVVDPDNPGQLVGIISRSDIVRSYPTENRETEPLQEAFLER